MEDSILESIKKLLGAENLEEFDENLVIFINGALNTLTQNGVGSAKGFRINGSDEKWSDFITNPNIELYELCKEFVYLRVKVIFDPASMSSYALKACQDQANEDLWRIREQADPADIFETEDEEDV